MLGVCQKPGAWLWKALLLFNSDRSCLKSLYATIDNRRKETLVLNYRQLGNAWAVCFFWRWALLRSRAHDSHCSIEKRCGKLGRYISYYKSLLYLLVSDAMKTVNPDGILNLDAPELRRRSAIVVNRLRQCIQVCKRVLLEQFQDTQCDAAGKLSQSIYVVESLLGKCHQEGDLLFFTIRQDPHVST